MAYSAYSYPEPPIDEDCAVVFIPMSLLPFVWGALAPLEERQQWETREDHERAYNALNALGACIMSLCASDLVESNRQIYRLLDTAINGAVYIATGDPAVIVPEIPAVPMFIIPNDTIMRRITRIEEYIDNGINGTTYTNLSDVRNVRQLLEDIKTAIDENNGLDPEILAKLGEIAVLMA